ncbi:unnamed protein product [uncultured virus]|nr:unnamed protein product [uncultured virus]
MDEFLFFQRYTEGDVIMISQDGIRFREALADNLKSIMES